MYIIWKDKKDKYPLAKAKDCDNNKLMTFTYQKDSYISSYLAGVSWLLYAYYFVVARDPLLASLFLTLGGLFATKVFIALYQKLKELDSGFALVVLVLGVAGALGTMVHGGYDLANAINPPVGANPSLPSQIDPRGLMAFGLTGLAVLKASWLMGKSNKFDKNLTYLGFLSGVLLIVIYLGRLTVLDPANPILRYPILVEGFVVNPLWYLWLGWMFAKK